MRSARLVAVRKERMQHQSIHRCVRTRTLAVVPAALMALVGVGATAPSAGAATSAPTAVPSVTAATLVITADVGCGFETTSRPTPVLHVWSASNVASGQEVAIAKATGFATDSITFDLPGLSTGTYVYGFFKGTEISGTGPIGCETNLFYIDGGHAYGSLDVLDADSDSDGLTDTEEAKLGSDPKDADTDNDGLEDGLEVNKYGTNPLLADTDGGGENDGAEVANGTDPVKNANDDDSDGDGLPDSFEVCTPKEAVGVDCTGTSPTDPDTDDDGLPDGTESCLRPAAAPKEDAESAEQTKKLISAATKQAQPKEKHCTDTDPLDPNDPGKDPGPTTSVPTSSVPSTTAVAVPVDSDHDGLGDDQEAIQGTDPHDPDTDGDGLNDGKEVTILGTNPRSLDTDGDGAGDGLEVSRGTNPLVAGISVTKTVSTSGTGPSSLRSAPVLAFTGSTGWLGLTGITLLSGGLALIALRLRTDPDVVLRRLALLRTPAQSSTIVRLRRR